MARHRPGKLNVGERGDEHDVERPLAHDLVGDRNVTTTGIVGLRDLQGTSVGYPNTFDNGPCPHAEEFPHSMSFSPGGDVGCATGDSSNPASEGDETAAATPVIGVGLLLF